jgi:hypothetical protein
MARRRVGETKRRLSFASASTPAPGSYRRGHSAWKISIYLCRPARSLLLLLVLNPVVVVVLLAVAAAGLVDNRLLLHRVDSYRTAVGEAGGGTGCLTMAYTSSHSLQRGAKTHFRKVVHVRQHSPTRLSTRLVVRYVIINNDLRAGIDTTAAEGSSFRNCHAWLAPGTWRHLMQPSTTRAARSQAQLDKI